MQKIISILLLFTFFILSGCATSSVNIREKQFFDTLADSTIEYLNINADKYPKASTGFNIDETNEFGKILAAKIRQVGFAVAKNNSKKLNYKINYLSKTEIVLLLMIDKEVISKGFVLKNNQLIPFTQWSVISNLK